MFSRRQIEALERGKIRHLLYGRVGFGWDTVGAGHLAIAPRAWLRLGFVAIPVGFPAGVLLVVVPRRTEPHWTDRRGFWKHCHIAINAATLHGNQGWLVVSLQPGWVSTLDRGWRRQVVGRLSSR